MSDPTVNRRNIEALAQAARKERERADAQAQQLSRALGMVASLTQRVTALEQQLAVLHALRGSEATCR